MKIIVAGYSKTGTTSMVAALSDLDYKVYDFLDHFWYHGNDWIRILSKGSADKDFHQMYKDIDAIADSPVYLYWEEILKAFPEAKIILTTRDEDKFLQSMVKQTKELKKNLMYQLIQVLSPTGRRYFRFFQLICQAEIYSCDNMCSAGKLMRNPFDFSYVQNETRLRKSFRQHQTYCMQNAPKDKLLVYDIKDGWEPLCRFLGKDVPDKPFPHENAGGVIMNRWMKVHPALIRMQREFAVCLATLVALGAFGIYKLHTSRIVKIGLFTFRFMERFKRV